MIFVSQVTANYRDVLQREQTQSAQDRKLEELQLVIERLTEEKMVLSGELKAAKEKLVSCESLMQRIQSKEGGLTSNPDLVNNQLQSLAKQVSAFTQGFILVPYNRLF